MPESLKPNLANLDNWFQCHCRYYRYKRSDSDIFCTIYKYPFDTVGTAAKEQESGMVFASVARFSAMAEE